MNGNSRFHDGDDDQDKETILRLIRSAEDHLETLRRLAERAKNRSDWTDVRETARTTYACLTNVLIIIRQKNLDYLAKDYLAKREKGAAR